MIDDFRDVPDGTRFDVDICVVGAGPAGIAIAREFVGTSTSVLLVESGGLEPAAATEVLSGGENVGLDLPTLHNGRTRAFGGATKLWPGQCVRLDEGDFEARDWVPDSGWPITKADLDPFYRRAEQWFGVPEAFDEQAWRRFGLLPPGFDPDRLRHKCSVYTAEPDVGAVHHDEVARADNVRVLLHATAARMHANGRRSKAETLEVRSLDGRVGNVGAGAFVLCGGGIENARLLLLSELGNQNDLVGRYFQEHPVLWVDLHPDRPMDLQQFYGHLGRGKVRYLPKIRLDPRTQRDQKVLSAVADPIWEPLVNEGLTAAREISSALQDRRLPRGLSTSMLRSALREVNRVGRAGFRRFGRGQPSAAPLERARFKILLEQAPNRDSRVTLSDTRDALGLPLAQVDWRLTDMDQRTAQTMTSVLDSEFRRLGLGRSADVSWLGQDDWALRFEEACHHMGTTRMSDDPGSGVVDADCQVHGVDGLFACGSSVFPIGGYANPTLTIVAIALRLADHLKKQGVGQP